MKAFLGVSWRVAAVPPSRSLLLSIQPWIQISPVRSWSGGQHKASKYVHRSVGCSRIWFLVVPVSRQANYSSPLLAVAKRIKSHCRRKRGEYCDPSRIGGFKGGGAMNSGGGSERTRKETIGHGGGSGGSSGTNPSPNPEWRFNQTLRNVQGLALIPSACPAFLPSVRRAESGSCRYQCLVEFGIILRFWGWNCIKEPGS